MYLKSNAPEIKWIIANAKSSVFAASLDARLLRTGELSDAMIAAVRRSLVAPADAVDVGDVSRVQIAFDHAKESGLKHPKMYLGAFLLKPAKATGKNPNSIYVTQAGEYLGKVADGKFHATRACTTEQTKAIVEVCSDPEKAAKAFGQETGRCSCCGRELTDPVSIANAIGPVCAERFGFA